MPDPLAACRDIPQDLDAERAVLGACLADNGAALSQIAFLTPDDFWFDVHRGVYRAMRHLQRSEGRVDLVLLLDRLRRQKVLDERYAEGYVLSLPEAVPSGEGVAKHPSCPPGIVEHARIVKREADRRRLLGIALELARLARDGREDDVCSLYDRAFAALQKHYPAAASEKDPATWADLDGIFGPIAWAWQHWLPRGFLTLLVGESGTGKSILALHLCSLFLGGNALWPDDTVYAGESGDVLWVEAEEAQWLNWERAKAWGLPVARIRTPFADPMHEVRLEDPAHRRAIERALRGDGVRFAVIDSLSGASQGDENSIEVLGVVKWLAALARDTGKAILLLHHLRKPGVLDGGRSELARVRGHSSIVQPARVVLSLDVPDPVNPETRRLRVIKNNIGPLPEPLGMRIGDRGVRFCEAPRLPERLSALDRAAQALLSILGAGPRLVQELEGEMASLGIAWGTVKRAKQKVGVVSSRVGDAWQWTLPDGGG
jgi:hypothetical protein